MNRKICVYASSANHLDEVYFNDARTLGRLIGENGDVMVYGGGDVGLMGACARSVHAHAGKVIGVIPESLKNLEIAYTGCDELIVTTTMAERKTIMEDKADLFIALPGGFGTLEEILQAVTLKQLHYHSKAIIFINTAGFYDALENLFEKLYHDKFAHPDYRKMTYFAESPEDAYMHLQSYQPEEFDIRRKLE